MRCEAQELANLLHESIDPEYYDLHLLPLGGIGTGDQGSLVSNLDKVTVMPVSILVDGSIPMVVVAEWAGAATAGTRSMEPRKAVIALDRVRYGSRRGRSDGRGADTAEVFIRGRSVVIDLRPLHDIIVKLGSLSWSLSAVVPR